MKGSTLIITKNFHPNIGGVETYVTEFIKCYIRRYSTFLYIICPIKGVHLQDSISKTSNISMITPNVNRTFINLDKERNIFLSIIQSLLYYYFILVQGAKLLLCKRNDISYIYGIGGPFSIFPSLILSKIFNKKCFGHIHADFQFAKRSKLARLFYKLIFGKLDRLFVNSKDAVIDLLNIGMTKAKICIVNNWVDTQIFKIKDKKTCRKILNLPLDKKILLFVGRLSKEKGILEVLDCIDILKNQDEILFIIIGDGSLRPVVEERIKHSKNTLFLGPKRNFELVDYLNSADLLLWGALDANYVSITIMEALHCGLPVVAPDTSTQDGKIGIEKFYVREDTLPAEVGMLFKSNVKSLAKAIDEFFDKRFDREEIKKYALEKYSEKNADLVFLYLR